MTDRYVLPTLESKTWHIKLKLPRRLTCAQCVLQVCKNYQKCLINYYIFKIEIQFTKQNLWISDWTERFCDLQLISGYVCSVPFCFKPNLKFLWSEFLLQRYVFFTFLLMFWTWATSTDFFIVDIWYCQFMGHLQKWHRRHGLWTTRDFQGLFRYQDFQERT